MGCDERGKREGGGPEIGNLGGYCAAPQVNSPIPLIGKVEYNKLAFIVDRFLRLIYFYFWLISMVTTGMNGKGDRLLPFLKWAGGKRWLAEKNADLLNVKYNRFIEPFLGGGAVFFRLRPSRAILSDSNERLIETYRAIKEDHEKVESHLRRHQRHHCKDYYYVVRQQRPRSNAGLAAQVIYLNRTCWNGLYRVNRNGAFNVPVGTKNSVLLSSDNFSAVADALSKVVLQTCDFEKTIKKAKKGDFVFADPPFNSTFAKR